MKKHALIVAFALLLALMFSTTAEAAAMGTRVYPTLTVSGTTATCKLRVAKPSAYINMTLELYRDGVPIVSWNSSGNNSVIISETYTVTSGHTYYLYAYGTAGGTAFNGQSGSITI